MSDFARWFAGTWARLYTLGLPPEAREARQDEIASDTWEQLSDDDGASGAGVLARVLLGMPADLMWRLTAAHALARDAARLGRRGAAGRGDTGGAVRHLPGRIDTVQPMGHDLVAHDVGRRLRRDRGGAAGGPGIVGAQPSLGRDHHDAGGVADAARDVLDVVHLAAGGAHRNVVQHSAGAPAIRRRFLTLSPRVAAVQSMKGPVSPWPQTCSGEQHWPRCWRRER